MQRDLTWYFPLPRTHTGILLGNATTGLMIWGEGSTLRLTIGRADFWDHRGGMPWSERHNYRDIRRLLEAGDEAGLRALFKTRTEDRSGQPPRPSVIPFGRMELDLGRGAELTHGTLRYRDGLVTVHYRRGETAHRLTVELSMTGQVAWIGFDGPREGRTVRAVSSWTECEADFRAYAMPEAVLLNAGRAGWCQPLPEDPALCAAWRRAGDTLWLVTARGDDADGAIKAAKAGLKTANETGRSRLHRANATWWRRYWADVPRVELPNERLQRIYQYGMTKFAGLTQPEGIAATLQGPWIEEYQMPPWSSDYHFNINVQMCYWPAYKGNRLTHLKPIFDLIFSWKDTLRENARLFLGIDDGYMLPHAVDDRCTCMGGFWTGCIDHGCTAWVAQMMFDYARYADDREFLREKAFPFMVGAMRVYEEMLERDGDRYRLPVSVSPEYRGAAMNAWGADASFQLACIHRLCENLVTAAESLDLPERPIWRDIMANLPQACIGQENGAAMIALWEGTLQEESHRHHSHLAGLAPFDVLDTTDPDWRPIIEATLRQWVYRGMGMWSGWCVPWASMLHSRFDNGGMAELLLEIWERVFTNAGYGTLHDCEFPGFTLLGGGIRLSHCSRQHEIMQMDAGMGAVAAVQEMLLHSRRGILHVMAGVPPRWRAASFDGMPCEFGCRIGARRVDGALAEVTLTADRDTVVKLANPFSAGCRAAAAPPRIRKQLAKSTAPVLKLTLKAGDTVRLEAR